MGKYDGLEGKKFGTRLVLERAPSIYRGQINYKTRCDCGLEQIVRACFLIKSESCVNCLRTKRARKHTDLVGRQFENWLVIELLPGDGPTTYKCECQCLNKTIANFRPSRLIRGETTKCKFCLGAYNKRKSWKGFGEVSGHLWSKYIHSAKRRHISFLISIEYVWDLFLKQNRRCALSGQIIGFSKTAISFDGTASLDRIDSSRGYIEGNVQWIHKDIQKMKWDFDEVYFVQMCRIIAENRSDLVVKTAG